MRSGPGRAGPKTAVRNSGGCEIEDDMTTVVCEFKVNLVDGFEVLTTEYNSEQVIYFLRSYDDNNEKAAGIERLKI